MTTDELQILESAISDVGYWSWWVAHVPSTFQIEFGSVQLWVPPTQEGLPPSGQLALRFYEPSCVIFLRRENQTQQSLADNWYEQLQADNLAAFGICYDAFTLSSRERAKEILNEAESRSIYHGSLDSLDDISSGCCCAFWAGPVGLYISAESMAVYSHHGEVAFKDLEQMSVRWWNYWSEYWAQKDTDNPMPEDFACEVTIPLADEPT